MVDVGNKPVTHRIARAGGCINMQSSTLERICNGGAAKGDVLGIARLAAIQATKRTGELIPLCHPLGLTHVDVTFQVNQEESAIYCEVIAENHGQTGVEMEAMTGVSIALLTIYDMCKAVDRGMTIGRIRLLEKSGGKSGHWLAAS